MEGQTKNMILSRARVTRVTADDELYVEAPSLGIGQDFGPVEVTNGTFTVGDRVLVGHIESSEDIVVITKVNGRVTGGGSGGGSVQAFYSDTEPLANMVGNLWINSGNANILNFWDGSEWIPVRDEGIDAAVSAASAAQTAAAAAVTAAGDAQTAAANALAVADSKVRTFNQDDPPSGPLPEGSLWLDSNNGNRLYRWFNNGVDFEWLPVLFGGQAIALGSIGPGHLDPDGVFPGGPDGDPPTEAPVISATAFPGGVNLRWNQITNHDPVTYEVRASTTSGGATTLVMETDSTYAPVREIAGVPLSTTAPTYFIVVPKDVDGVGPASNEVSATARKLTQAEIDDAFTDFLDDIQQTAQEAHQNAENAVQTFYRSTAPTNPADNLGVGDLWFDTSDGNHPHRWDGSTWLSIKDEAVAQAAADAFDAATDAMDAAIAAQATADGAIRTYYLADPPWANGTTQPASVVGDMWFDTDNGQAYRWNGTNWQLITDNAIAEALQAAQDAQVTADGKITAWYQTDLSVAPTAANGDILFRTDLQNRMYRLDAGAWVPLQQKSPDEINDDLGAAIDQIEAIEITANGKNRIYWSTDSPPATGTFVDGDVWFQKNGTSLQIDGMWQYDGGEAAWFAQELSDAMFANLDVLGHLQAGSIGAEYLLIGDFTNNVTNPSFEYGDGFAGWEGKNSFTNVDTTIKRTGDQSMRFTGNATLKSKNTITVETGDELLFSVWYRTSSGVTPADCRFAAFDQDGTQNLGWDIFSSPNFAAQPSTDFIRATATFVVEPGITEITPAFISTDIGQTVWIDDVTVRRKGTGELIVDGSILAEKIAADSITGDQINSEWLSSLRVDANKINAGQITSNLAMSGEFKICKLLSDDTGDLTPDPESNVIEFNLVSGMRFRIPNGTDVDGNVTYDDILHLPIGQVDPATGERAIGLFKGIVQSEQVTTKVLELSGDAHASTDPDVSKILTSATLRMENLIEDPVDSPTMAFGPRTSKWPSVSGFSEVGMGHHGAFLVQGRLDQISGGVQNIRGRYINPTNGTVDHSDSNARPFYAVAGFTCTGGYYFVLHKFLNGASPWTISRFNRSDWTPTGHDLDVDNLMGGGFKTGCLGDAGRDDCVAFAYRNSNDELRIRYYTLQLNPHGTLPARTSMTLTTVREMIGVPNVDVVAGGNTFFWCGGGTHSPEQSWTAPEAMTGAAFWNGQYVSTAQNGKLAKYNELVTDESTLLKTAYARVQTLPSLKRTKMSQVKGSMWPTRQYATINTPDLIPGTNDVYIYAGGIDNDRTNLHLIPGKITGQTTIGLDFPPTTGENPVLTSEFSGGSSLPGAIESRATIPGDVRTAIGLYGDGTARLYGLKQPSIKRRRNNVTAVPTGSGNAVKIDWDEGDSPAWDNNFILWDNVNKRFYLSWAGVYLINAHITWDNSSNAGGYRSLQIFKNGSLVDEGMNAGSTTVQGTRFNGLIQAATNDYIETWVMQNSGVSVNLRTTLAENYISILRLGL